MTAVAMSVRVPQTRSTLGVLARIEAKRFARHPLFLVGFALGLASVIGAGSGVRGPTFIDFAVVPAFFVGIIGFVVALRLTRSTDRSQEVIEGSPVSDTLRTAALCLACTVPLVAGTALVLAHWALVAADPPADWLYGTYDTADRWLIIGVIPAIACLGAPLLGVVVGRWLRFPGAALLAVMVLLGGSMVASYGPLDPVDESPSVLARVLHVLSPYTSFATANGTGRVPSSITSFTGSPGWYAGWLLSLCGLAVTAALWRGAEGASRRVIGRTFVGLAILAVALVGAAAVGGNDQPMLTTPDGLSRPAPTD